MLVGCGYKDELKSKYIAQTIILGTMAELVAGFTTLNYHKK